MALSKPHGVGKKTLLAFLLTAGVAGALPENPDVRHGNVQFGLPAANIMQILQSSPQAIVNWNAFNIGPAERVLILQPDVASLLLNRVTGQDPSVLQGLLQANGRVFLLNPNGVLFGPGAVVDAGSFMASTLSMSDEDFLSGRFRLTQAADTPLAAVVNQGEIRVAEGGFVVLVAPIVHQDGLIVAQAGQVNLGATTQATFSLDGRGLVEFATADGFEPTFSRSGGQGGTVLLSPGQMTQMLGQVVRAPDVDEASAFAVPSGEGILVHSGTTQANEGAIRLDSSQATYLTRGSSLITDGQAGGGDIRVLSAGLTYSGGNISAQSSQGPGGFVEVSGKQLHLSGAVNVASQVGLPGQLLLDPLVLNIIDGPPPAGSLDGLIPPGVGANDGNVAGTDTVSTGAIAAVTGTVTLAALSDINYTGPGPFLAPNTDLVLNAGQDINFANSGLTAASINFTATRDINFNNIDTVQTQNGDLRLSAGRNVTLDNPINNQFWDSNGVVAVNAGGNITGGTLHFTARANNGITLTGSHVDFNNTLVDLDGGVGAVDIRANAGNARLGNGAGDVALSSTLSTSVRATGDLSVNAGTNVFRLATLNSDLVAGQDFKLNALNLNTPGKLNVTANRDIIITAPPGAGFTVTTPDELVMNAGRDLSITTDRNNGLDSVNNMTLSAGRNLTLDAPGIQNYVSTNGNLTLTAPTITGGSNTLRLSGGTGNVTINSGSVLDLSTVTNLQVDGEGVNLNTKDTLQPIGGAGGQITGNTKGINWTATGGLDLTRVDLQAAGSTANVSAAGNLRVNTINGANATLAGGNVTVVSLSNTTVTNMTINTPGVLVEKVPTAPLAAPNFDNFTVTAAQAFGEQAPFRFSVPRTNVSTTFNVTGGNDTLQNPVAAASLQNVNGANVQPVVNDNTGDVYVDGVLFYRGKAPVQPAQATETPRTNGEIKSRADLDDLQEAEVLQSLAQNNLALGNLEGFTQLLSATARKRTTVLAESLSTPYPSQPFSPTLALVLGSGLGSSLDQDLAQARAEVGAAVNTQLLLERQDIWQVRYWRDLLQDSIVWGEQEDE